MSYLYSLRFAVDPGRTEAYSLEQLPEYVRAARIDDVMVFANVEELNTGHTDLRERAVFRDLAERTATVAARADASMSLNPWHTVMHGDYGKRLREGQSFRRMVDPRGRVADLVVCPRDEAWRTYLAQLYEYYASARPRFLWVEDDFRYHNHPPLWWGGCFCDEHLAEFSRRAGRPLTREEFVSGMLQPGEVSEFRGIWLDTAREALEETAAAIERAVHAVSPGTRLGLMTSVPAVHAAEGRHWAELLGALSGEHPPAVRIHLPAYSETRPAEYLTAFHLIADLHRALLPATAEIYPELENFPYSRFAKSSAFLRFQLLSAQVLALDGMTLDLFDLNGNGIVWTEGYQDALAATKDYLERTAPVFRETRGGVVVLVDEDSSAALHTSSGAEMTELYPREGFFAGLLGAYGIAFRFSTDSDIAGAVVAVSGQLFRTIGVERTRALFLANRLLLDAEAVDTLIDMGLGSLAGAETLAWSAGDAGAVTYEEAVRDAPLLGRPAARASVLLMGADIAQVTYVPGRSRALTTLRAPGHEDRGTGHAIVDDRVMIVPFGRIDALAGLVPMVRTTLRQEMMHGVLDAWRADVVRVEGCADVALYEYRTSDELLLYLVNASLDPVPRLRLRLPSASAVSRVAADHSDRGRTSPEFVFEGGRLLVETTMAPLESVLIRIR
ncbi:hypothetical protein [Microbacterium sp.]|uniref:hypothetical protein n=1 Tax=Microbacterium sp. TaxID=51671 RepID=UPI00092C76DE|nr:hypothetical protein [Microbacterium sp.]MBN9190610.1 hypothetical protein [Microbacterium sp.]MBN9193007.1 hypothetical protein [Microbacterium sp.]OJU61349.1 MAG: hypothetical protein BGO04_10635 [Microbacterium sp. 70-38]